MDRIYEDLGAVCRARIVMAREKPRSERKRRRDSVTRVAGSVAGRVRGLLERKRFPEDFMTLQGDDVVELVIARGQLRQIDLYPLMDRAELRLVGTGSEPIYEDNVPWPVAEVVAAT